MDAVISSLGVALAGAGLLTYAWRRVALSRAKHRSLAGHAKISSRLARWLPALRYEEDEVLAVDAAPSHVVVARQNGLDRLARHFQTQHPTSKALAAEATEYISDVKFTSAYRVPPQFSQFIQQRISSTLFVEASEGVCLVDVDGRRLHDLSGSYGVNVFGYDFYKDCIAKASERVGNLGPVLGTYHPLVIDNARRIADIADQDEVSFHMSGTEAVMQAVRLARFHTRRRKLVRFCGAYHGWWGDVQPGVGNPMPEDDTFTLTEMSERSLDVLATRDDVACVLVNPLQALHPNRPAPADSGLVDSSRQACFDRAAYTQWLIDLRQVCSERGIVLIFDEVFMGFRLAKGGAQEYFGVHADLVTYGKTLGGGLPIGVVCGPAALMKRFREQKPADICLARGTFNAHPYVMAAMQEFLNRLDRAPMRELYSNLDTIWDARAHQLNRRLADAGLPVRVANLSSVWTTLYSQPSRYNWMFQFYLRAQGLVLSWVGTGRLIFAINYSDTEFAEVEDRFVRAAQAMQADGWWWHDGVTTNADIRRATAWDIVRHRLGLQRWPSESKPA